MSKDHAYGDGIILAMVPFVFHRNVVIYYCDRTISLCESSEREPIRLGYVNQNHYVSVLRLETNTIDQNENVPSALVAPLKTAKLFQQTENTELSQLDNLEVNQEKVSKEQTSKKQTSKVQLQTLGKTCGTRNSTVTSHPWISCQNDGYYCTTCRDSEFAVGPWVTVPIAKNNSKKLYTKAQKHANSTVHKMAVEKSKSGTTVFEKQCEASNRQTDEQRLHLTNMFRAAYFLFKSELPHTTSRRNLISLVSALDGNGKMTSRLKTAHANAHHLSSTAITDIKFWGCNAYCSGSFTCV